MSLKDVSRLLASYWSPTSTLHIQCDSIKPPFINNETRTSIIAEQSWHPRLCTQYSASRLTTSLVLGFSPRMRFSWEVGKGNYAEETDQRYGTRRKYAMEERSHLKEDIRKPVLPCVRLLLVSHRLHFLFTWSFYFLSKSFITAHDSIICSCFLDIFSLSKSLVQIKVPHRQITGISIRCA